jgi:hypothetical protein
MAKIRVYYHYQLDASSQEKGDNELLLRARELEKKLKDRGFEIFGFATGINGASDSLLIGKLISPSQSLSKDTDYIRSLINALHLPYGFKGIYSKK